VAGNKIDILSNFYPTAFPYPFLCAIRAQFVIERIHCLWHYGYITF